MAFTWRESPQMERADRSEMPQRDGYTLEALRKENRESRASPFFAVDRNRAMMLFDNTLDHGESKTGSLAEFFGRVKRFENLRELVFRDAVARIADRQFDPVLFRP